MLIISAYVETYVEQVPHIFFTLTGTDMYIGTVVQSDIELTIQFLVCQSNRCHLQQWVTMKHNQPINVLLQFEKDETN